jgi:Autographiviridae endonuclease VII
MTARKPKKYKWVGERARNLRRRYNITLEDWKLQHEIQEGKCAICSEEVQNLCVDHCHDTGNIRGLLCQNCNRGLGLLGDNLQRVERAYIYMLIAYDKEPHNDNNPV